ncbi:PREDICTED: pulmonary surfactant-associated protein C-like [Calidris pugnax]|uniref:pulmonary surfactant-associated protein C-like n=1 Tax=Calidris pugnax TaxID=198806 RepID=UPI00071E5DCD|nr:PREDICTED: pulmonary surfactant-associated protein C-like [Calidris pugnax]
MESSMKEVVVVEEPLDPENCGCLKRSLCCLPRLLCYLPRKLLSCCHLKCLLITVVVVVLLVVIIAGILLMWLRVDQQHADAVLRMGLQRGWAWEEDVATFYLDGGDGNPATVIYDYKNLLVSFRSHLHRACYVTRVDKDNIPGLDAIAETFQRRLAEKKLAVPLADRSLLGTTASILCSIIPIYQKAPPPMGRGLPLVEGKKEDEEEEGFTFLFRALPGVEGLGRAPWGPR